MHEEILNEFKKDLAREIAKQTILKNFYKTSAEGEAKEESAKLKLKAVQLEDNIAFNQKFLDYINTL